jgi:hypothetical protein
VPKTPKSGVGLERNQVPLSAEITCRLRPKSGAGLLRFLQYDPASPSNEGFCRNDTDITSAIAKRFETAA